MKFELITKENQARRGRITFPRGYVVNTPAFMPVGTYGSVKAMTPEEIKDAGAEIILLSTAIMKSTTTFGQKRTEKFRKTIPFFGVLKTDG